jgi:CHRD domain-containing protein
MVEMRKALAISAVAAAILVMPSVSAGSRATNSTYHLKASMNTRQVVTPKNRMWRAPASVRKAHGSFRGAFRVSGARRILHWRITYAGISSKPQIADIHYGRPRHFGPILVRLCGPCRSGQSGNKKISARGARALKAGSAWITIITNRFPNGVVRGQVNVS